MPAEERTEPVSLADQITENTRVGRLIVRRLRQRTWWFAAVILTVVLCFVSVMWWNRVSIRRSQQQWCGTLTIIVAPGSPAPTTERGRQVADALHQLARRYGCLIS